MELFADAGVENGNSTVDAALDILPVRRVRVQVDIVLSNSTTEGFWRSRKHRWLFLHHLDSVATASRLGAFYVQQHDEVLPHPAFDGQTPDEVYCGLNTDLDAELVQLRRTTRRDRVEANRGARCGVCPRVHAGPPGGAKR